MQTYATTQQQYPSYMYAPPQQSNAGLYAATQALSRPQTKKYGSSAAQSSSALQYNSAPVIPPEGGRMSRPRKYQSDRDRDRDYSDREWSDREWGNLEMPVTVKAKTDPKAPRSAMKRSKRSDTPGPGLHRSRTSPPSELPLAVVETRRQRSESENKAAEAVGLLRTRTTSDPYKIRANSLSRPRSRNQAMQYYTPAQVILQLSGSNKITLSSVMFQVMVDDIRERVLSMWPDGVVYQKYRNEKNDFSVQFNGNPWTVNGTLRVLAMKMILELFSVLARSGYVCTSAFDMANNTTPPHFVFSLTNQDPVAEFFMICFSNSRRRLKLVNQPEGIGESLYSALRDAFPRKVLSAGWEKTDMYKIEMNGAGFSSIADLLLASILQHLSSEGYKLECAIPIGQPGFLGFLQDKKELWIFKRVSRHHPPEY